jgi:hypothetical protein
MIEDIFIDDTDFMTIEELKSKLSWPLEYTSTLGITPYISRLGENIVGAEIGTARGESVHTTF